MGAASDPAVAFNATDMVSNACEWTRSLYRAYPYDPGDGREDLAGRGPQAVRGGSFYFNSTYARCTYRYGCDPLNSSGELGFRPAVAPAP